MLAIRLQRVGRKGYPVYRLAVQEAQRHPTSGRVVAYVGNYNPHTKAVAINKDKVSQYLKNGAQPSPRVVRLLEAEKIDLPTWVTKAGKKEKKLRNPDKLRKNQPAKPAEETAATPVSVSDDVVDKAVVKEVTEAPVEDASVGSEPEAKPESDEATSESAKDVESTEKTEEKS